MSEDDWSPRRRPQMADVARLAGVSRATVSRALSDSPAISEQTKQSVREIARSLNYTVNVGAKNLRQGTNRTVGFVIPYQTSVRQAVSDPFFLSMLGSVADAVTDRGFEMLVSRVDATAIDQVASAFESGRACGVILIGQWHQHGQLNRLARRGVPLVVWGGVLSRQSYATVGGDNQLGGYLATRHLLQRGARQIAFLGNADLPEVGLRLQGYLKAHAECGCKVLKRLQVNVPFAAEQARQAIDQYLATRPRLDAIFASSDLLAMIAIQGLGAQGILVPQDVAVVGYDDVPMAASFNPPLTTITQHVELAGEQMVDALLEIVAGRKPSNRTLPTSLIARQSA